MVFFHRGQKVLGVVDGSLPCLDESRSQYATWIQFDDVALSWITFTLSRPVLNTFLNHECHSSYQAWTILQKLFLANASATQIQLRYKFQHFKKDSDLVAQALLVLPFAFGVFKTVMNASNPRPLLLSEEDNAMHAT
ncbi:hypothetical protein LIER_12927 [Lithospermum erythrorhizon]|uniref:Uncharacterized protein n=1 Tax=Lithospermum erythrorhizon TaxID=34254 RepID=A0AAV3PV42_LITER